MKKKLLVIMLALAMVFAFAACGGGGGGGSDAPAADSSAEPHAGVSGIVFTVPDDWTLTDVNIGSHGSYSIPGSDYCLVTNSLGEKELEENNKWSEEKFDSVQAYYDKYYAATEEELKEKDIEHTIIKVCDTDADYNKYTGGKDGFYELGTYWMLDNTIYSFYLYNDKNFGDGGKIKDDATPLTDDQIKQYEDIIASIQKGDGVSFLKEGIASLGTNIGSLTYAVPEGFSVSRIGENFIELNKEGSPVYLQISMTTENELQYCQKADGSVPESLEDWFNVSIYEGIEETEIAGYKGYIDKNPYDDEGNCYDVNAGLLADDAIYNVYMGTDAHDTDGNLKEDAVPLTDEDLAAFDALVASLAKK